MLKVVYLHEPALSYFEESVVKIERDRKSILKVREERIKIVELY